MERFTNALVSFQYHYTMAIGVLRFRYDSGSNQVHTTRFITIYSIAMNVLTIASLPWIYHNCLGLLLQHRKASLLFNYVYVSMKIVRIVAVVTTIVFNWQHRAEFISVINDFHALVPRYFKNHPLPRKLRRRFQLNIIRNFLSGILVDLLQCIVQFNSYNNNLSNFQFICSSITLTLITNMMFAVKNHYFFTIQYVILYGHVLNRRLRRVLKAIRRLTNAHQLQPGLHQSKQRYLTLIAEVERLSRIHGILQDFANRIIKIFSVQGLCVISDMYITNMATIYVGYTYFRMGEFTFSSNIWSSIAYTASLLIFYLDLQHFLAASIELINIFGLSAILLERHMTLPKLRIELERSLDNFHFQLARNPFRLRLMDFFQFDNEMAFSMVVAALSNSILIMQFDYKYF